MGNPSPFGQWLQATRNEQGLTQQKLAELAEVHRIQIVYIESGRTRLPRLSTRMRLYQALGAQPAGKTVAAS